MDGKALHHAGNKDAPMTYIVSAWAAENGLTLGQVKVEDKSNEITGRGSNPLQWLSQFGKSEMKVLVSDVIFL